MVKKNGGKRETRGESEKSLNDFPIEEKKTALLEHDAFFFLLFSPVFSVLFCFRDMFELFFHFFLLFLLLYILNAEVFKQTGSYAFVFLKHLLNILEINIKKKNEKTKFLSKIAFYSGQHWTRSFCERGERKGREERRMRTIGLLVR